MEDFKDNATISSSLINLKAELFRKQEEFKKQKIENQNASYIKIKPAEKSQKVSIWSRQNAGVLQRAQTDLDARREEEDELLKSKKSLEAKVKLYDQLSQSSEIPEEDGSKYYLVDFQKKVIDDIIDKREAKRSREDKELALSNETETEIPAPAAPAAPAAPEEEWVDYVDSFGRSRRCMKKDLPDLLKRDQTHPPFEGKSVNSGFTPSLLSEDMRREMLREKWEEEETAALNMPAGPIHYSNVQHNEIRSHGVGYYQFAEHESTRLQQMDTLKTMRKETVDERARKERIKEKRKAMLDARLAKIKQRRKMKDGGSFGADDSEEKEETGEDIGPKLSERVANKAEAKPVTEPKLLVREDSWRKTAPVREWDRGKEKLFPRNEDQYLMNRREERLTEFGPPSLYDRSTKILPKIYTEKQKAKPLTFHEPKTGLTVDNKVIENSSTETSGSDYFAHIPMPPENELNAVSQIPMPPENKLHAVSEESQSKNVQDLTTTTTTISSGYSYAVHYGLFQNVLPPQQWGSPFTENYSNHLPALQVPAPIGIYSQTNICGSYIPGSSQSQFMQSTCSTGTVHLDHCNTVPLQNQVGISSSIQPEPVVTDSSKPLLPKLSIVDTRLIQNEDALLSDQTELCDIQK